MHGVTMKFIDPLYIVQYLYRLQLTDWRWTLGDRNVYS